MSVLILVPDRWTWSCRPSDFTLSLFSLHLAVYGPCSSLTSVSSYFLSHVVARKSSLALVLSPSFPLPSCISIQPLLGSFIAPLSTSIARDRTFQYMFLISHVGGFSGHRVTRRIFDHRLVLFLFLRLHALTIWPQKDLCVVHPPVLKPGTSALE